MDSTDRRVSALSKTVKKLASDFEKLSVPQRIEGKQNFRAGEFSMALLDQVLFGTLCHFSFVTTIRVHVLRESVISYLCLSPFHVDNKFILLFFFRVLNSTMI